MTKTPTEEDFARLQAERDRAKADADLCAEQWTAEIESGNALRAMVAPMHAALKKAEQFIVNGVEFGYIRMPGAGDPALNTLEEIRSAMSLPPPVKEAEPEPVAWIPSHLLALLRRNRDHMRALVRAGRDANHDTPLYTTPPALQARVEALEGALREAQSVLAMLVEPGAIQQTTVINAYAAAKTAEAKARAALTGEKEGEADGR